jgi:sporulation and spore germination protein/immunoglobulin-like protein involved in spore germination
VHRLALALALLLLALAGCGGGGNDEAAAPPATTEAPAADSGLVTTAAPDETTSLDAFFLRDGSVAPVARTVPQTQAVATAALEALFAGPSSDEAGLDVETAIPEGTRLMSIDVTSGVATVDLSNEFDALRPPESMNPSLAQITYTLTQFPTIRRVWVAVRGEPVGDQTRPMTRATFPKYTPLILVEHPAIGETVSSPVAVSGTASVFEATLRVRLEGPDGAKLWEDTVTASEGAPGRGQFSVEIPFTAEGPGKVVAFAPSAKDGEPQHTFEVEVVLAP